MKLIIIPGAYSSRTSWVYFESDIPESIEKIFLAYNPENPLEEIIKNFEKTIDSLNEDVILVGHSLGGIIALNLAHRCKNIKKVITIAAPYGGILISRWMVYISMFLTPFNNLWMNTHPENKLITHLYNKNPKIPALIYTVETQNSTMWLEPSDGIVTVSSQKALGTASNITYKNIYGTHADAMLSPEFIADINMILASK